MLTGDKRRYCRSFQISSLVVNRRIRSTTHISEVRIEGSFGSTPTYHVKEAVAFHSQFQSSFELYSFTSHSFISPWSCIQTDHIVSSIRSTVFYKTGRVSGTSANLIHQ